MLLAGCLLNRVAAVKEQSCDVEAHFQLAQGDRLAIHFLEPVLLPGDVPRLLGLEPSAEARENDVLRQDYVVVKEAATGPVSHSREQERFDVNLAYTWIEGDYRLSRVELPELMQLFLEPELFAEGASELCAARINLRLLSRSRGPMVRRQSPFSFTTSSNARAIVAVC